MAIATISFGVGTLIIGALLKLTPEKWLEKLDFSLNEDGVKTGTDFITRVQDKITVNFKRTETERLLDSR
jgi:hypothetical protein